MHGSVEHAKKLVGKADVNQVEATSGRTALHKAAFWGHVEMVTYLVQELKLNVNAQVTPLPVIHTLSILTTMMMFVG